MTAFHVALKNPPINSKNPAVKVTDSRCPSSFSPSSFLFFFPFHSKESAFPVTGTSSETLSEFSLILKNSGSPGTFLAPESNDSGSAELGITSSVTWDGGCVLLVFS